VIALLSLDDVERLLPPRDCISDLHHAIAAGVKTPQSVHGELAES